ncbi:hypothetical protein LAJ19_16595 (plasmid) [Deinococcus taeanensis]|uniref:hypothetical protein n=1 Tax=Deinococcus taeanensis TaxID=2737050 RepID=UPI001CDB7E2F|nr:hypothetical protein [Deinococcus taeanensis]UBV44769.1 hypothetical protein LAJ19_16595 [Deinococcus taeanensis]
MIPVNVDWRVIPVRSDYGCLTEYIEGLINYIRANNILLRVEQYFPGHSQSEAAFEINALQISNEEAISLIMTEGYICDTLMVTSDQDTVLISTHEMTSIFIAKEATINEITGKSILQMQHEYAEYINDWSGIPGKNANSLLNLSSDYPKLFIGSPSIEIKFDTLV